MQSRKGWAGGSGGARAGTCWSHAPFLAALTRPAGKDLLKLPESQGCFLRRLNGCDGVLLDDGKAQELVLDGPLTAAHALALDLAAKPQRQIAHTLDEDLAHPLPLMGAVRKGYSNAPFAFTIYPLGTGDK